MENFRTIPEMLLNCARRHANDKAVNDRVDGIWRAVSTAELVHRVSCLAAMLDSREPQAGACVGVLAAPSANWLAADLAIMLAGSVSVPFFVDFSEAHFLHKVEDADMKTIFVFGPELWARFLPFADRFDLVITDQHVPDLPTAVHVDELYAEGAKRITEEPELVQRLSERISPDDLAVIIYTSGSTGMPKGVELTHNNLAAQLHDIIPLFPMKPGLDRGLSLLPIAHTFERIVIYLYLAQGMCIYFVDDIGNVGQLMGEVHPTMMTVVPRLLEKTHNGIRERTTGLAGPKGKLSRWAFERANRIAEGSFSLCNVIADRLVGRQVYKAFGGKLRTMVVGGAHMPDELNRFFVRVGIPIYEGYGLTEASPVLCTNYPGQRRVGTVGRPLISVEIKTSNEGEVWARGPNIMRGYRHMPEETERVIDADGWLHTGDLGRIDDGGYLTIVARQKELFKTSTGETVFPGPMEQALCRSEWIEMACIIAEARKHTSCLLFLNPAAISLPSPALHEQIKAHIQQVNEGLDRWEKIHAYALLPELPSVENGELTPTLKIRRHVVEKHYKNLIDRLYDETQTTEDSHEFTIGHC
jgi:long-chain acyl-CoA synthetase